MNYKKIFITLILSLTLFVGMNGVSAEIGSGGTNKGDTAGSTGGGCYSTSYGIKVTVKKKNGKTNSRTYSSTYGKGYTLQKTYKCDLRKWLYYENGTKYNADVLNKCLDIPSTNNPNRDYYNIAKIAKSVKGSALESGEYIYIEPYTFCNSDKVYLRTSNRKKVSGFCKNSNYRQVCAALANSATVGGNTTLDGYFNPNSPCKAPSAACTNPNTCYGNYGNGYSMCGLQNNIKRGYGIIVISTDSIIKKINIQITKTDDNGNKITGSSATIKLCTKIKSKNGYEVCESGVISTKKTSNGSVTFKNLKYKKGENVWFACETEAPNGYNRAKKCKRIPIDSKNAKTGEGYTKSIDFKNTKKTSEATGTLKIIKYEYTGSGNVTANTKDLKLTTKDVKFTILNRDKKKVSDYTYKSGSQNLNISLKPGTYYIKENVVSGYNLSAVKKGAPNSDKLSFVSASYNDSIKIEIKEKQTTKVQFINSKKDACDERLNQIKDIKNKNYNQYIYELLKLHSAYSNKNKLLNFDNPACESDNNLECNSNSSNSCTKSTIKTNTNSKCLYDKNKNQYVFESGGITLYCHYELSSYSPSESPFSKNQNPSVFLGRTVWEGKRENVIFAFKPKLICESYYIKNSNNEESMGRIKDYAGALVSGVTGQYTIVKDDGTKFALSSTMADESDDFENQDEEGLGEDAEEYEPTTGEQDSEKENSSIDEVNEETIDCTDLNIINSEEDCNSCFAKWNSDTNTCAVDKEEKVTIEETEPNCTGNYCHQVWDFKTNEKKYYYGETLRWKFANLTGAATNSDEKNYIGYRYGIPVNLDERIGQHTISILFNYNLNINEESKNNELKHQCNYNVAENLIPDPSDENKRNLNLEFRVVDTTNPFPGINGEGRTIGSNWKNNITKATDRNNSYSNKPILSLRLNTKNINKIREYNKNNPKYSTSLECNNGEQCKTDFVSLLLNGTYGIASGSCEKGENRNYCVGDSE